MMILKQVNVDMVNNLYKCYGFKCNLIVIIKKKKGRDFMTEKEKLFFEHELKYLDYAKEGKMEEFWREIDETWKTFDYPYYQDSLFYHIIEDIINVCIDMKNFEKANKYVSLLFISGQKRADDGTRELLAARLAYEQGDIDVARELAYVCNEKSEGRRLKKHKELRELLKKMNSFDIRN